MTTEHICTRHAPGTPTCYRAHACRCTECRQAGNAYGKRSHAGLTRRIPSHLIVCHLERIGITDRDASRRSGINYTSIARIRNGTVATVRQDTARKLLALTAGPANSGTIPAIGTVRRLQALAALGYTSEQIATHSGIPHGYVRKLMQATRPTVNVATATRVLHSYDALAMKTPPAGWVADRQRRQAAGKGWPPPLAWDDDEIDNPNARPNLGEGHNVWGSPLENVEWLAETGEKLPGIARQLGKTEDSIKTLLWRHGRTSLLTKITPDLNPIRDNNTKGRAAA